MGVLKRSEHRACSGGTGFRRRRGLPLSLQRRFGVDERAVDNSGFIGLNPSGYDPEGGTTLSIGGTLTNTRALSIGNTCNCSPDSVTAKSFVYSRTVYLTGDGTGLVALSVSGATTNNGSISIASDTEELPGAVGDAGSFSLSIAHFLFDSSVSAGQTITESGANALRARRFLAAFNPGGCATLWERSS
jgi:hypothetical protein